MTRLSVIVLIFLICLIIWTIVMQIKEYHLQDDPILYELKNNLRPLFNKDINYSGVLQKLNTYDILDKIKVYKGNKSYTINKEKVYLCLLDENGQYYNKNMLYYVLLHEIAHCICDEIGHTEKFNDIFEELLIKATELGIYNPSIPIIQNYCQHENE